MEGKRVRYFKPFAFAFLLSTIYTVINAFSDESSLIVNVDSEVHEDYRLAHIISLVNWVNQHLAYGSILMLPLISAGTYFAFLKSKYNYPEHLVLNAYVLGLMMFVMGTIDLIFYIFRLTPLEVDIFSFVLISFLIYLSFFKNIGFIKRLFFSFLAICLIGVIFGAVIIIITIIPIVFN